jgi:hypothetical protein
MSNSPDRSSPGPHGAYPNRASGVTSPESSALARGASQALPARRCPTDATGAAQGRRSWRCRVGVHDYHAITNDEGAKYLVCSRCQKEDYPGSSFNTMPNG